jgi:tripartite-type tricarboxylate transporter receptor subunit TctC
MRKLQETQDELSIFTSSLLAVARRCRAGRLWCGAGAGQLAQQADHADRPFPARRSHGHGGTVLAQQVGQQLGQSVIVDNRPGANGNIGNALVAKAPADGYTVLYNTSSIALSLSLYKKMSYDVTRDLRPVALTAVVPLGLVVNPKVPANTVQELVKYAQDHKGKLSYGSAGNGNVTHLAAFQVVQHYNMDASHVPYKGSAPADVDLVAGQIDFMTDTINSVAPFIKDGRLRLLAVSTAGRIPNFPMRLRWPKAA